MAGDFNGDNRTDIVGRDPVQGFWHVGLTEETVATTSRLVTSRWSVAWLETGNYTDFQVGDFNGDGFDDIAGREITTGTWRLGISTGSAFADAVWQGAFGPNIIWTAVVSGDFDGDGQDDIVGFDGVTGQGYLATSTGSSFDVTTWEHRFRTSMKPTTSLLVISMATETTISLTAI